MDPLTPTLVASIVAAAMAVSVPPTLLLSVAHCETGIRTVHSPADGGSASYGALQVKLGTARRFNKKVRPSELLQPFHNALYGALYLDFQLGRYAGDWERAVAAYNAGSLPKACRGIPGGVDGTRCPKLKRYVNCVARAMEEQPWLTR